MFGAPSGAALRAAIGATVAFYLGWIVIDDAVLAAGVSRSARKAPLALSPSLTPLAAR